MTGTKTVSVFFSRDIGGEETDLVVDVVLEAPDPSVGFRGQADIQEHTIRFYKDDLPANLELTKSERGTIEDCAWDIASEPEDEPDHKRDRLEDLW